MAYDEALAQRIEKRISRIDGLQSKKMFGGIGFLLYGNMAVGVYKNYMIVRVGSDNSEELLKEPFAKVFDITGRPMAGWILVDALGLENEKALQFWVEKGVNFASSLPAK